MMLKNLQIFSKLLIKKISSPLLSAGKAVYSWLPKDVQKHFSTSNLKTLLIGCFLLTNVLSLVFTNEQQKRMLQAARWPMLPNPHLQLSKYFFNNGQLAGAKKEIVEIENFLITKKLVKISSKQQKKLVSTKQMLASPKKIKKELKKSLKILQEKPFYRNVLLKTSLAYHQMWKEEQAIKYWKKAFYLAPNDQKVQEAGKVLETLNN